MRRFYHPVFFSSAHVTLSDPREIHHLKDVLRFKKGDTIILFNGHGDEAEAEIALMSDRVVEFKIQKVTTRKEQGPVIILACAIPKRGKFELIIEKATELGVSEIIPLKTERSQIDLKGERLTHKSTRYQTVAINAAKQCQRPTIPKIHPFKDFNLVIEELKPRATIFFLSLEERSKRLFDAFLNCQSSQVAFFIGPEGDFTPEEYEFAKKSGAIAVTLGQNVLKVETAAIAAMSTAHLFFHK